jgi:hypothetical protein
MFKYKACDEVMFIDIVFKYINPLTEIKVNVIRTIHEEYFMLTLDNAKQIRILIPPASK